MSSDIESLPLKSFVIIDNHKGTPRRKESKGLSGTNQLWLKGNHHRTIKESLYPKTHNNLSELQLPHNLATLKQNHYTPRVGYKQYKPEWLRDETKIKDGA